ncbi:MAG: hypothetical protein ACJZ12_02260 [Candidatus Neomarinimicrobiota bacterium]
MRLYCLYAVFLYNGLIGQTEVTILSDNVGTEIDRHENRFYKIFPDEKGLVDAQFVTIEDNKYAVYIVKKINGSLTKVHRYLNQEDFDQLKNYVDLQPVMTKEAKIAMYKGMNFLRAEKIIEEIPKPQYVDLRYLRNKKIRGTLFKTENNILFIQTVNAIERINLNDVDIFSYRSTVGEFNHLRPYTTVITSIVGFAMATLYNIQRPVTYNEYGYARNDIAVYRQIFGTIIGLIFSGEVFDGVSTLLTTRETIILSEAEYDKQNH